MLKQSDIQGRLRLFRYGIIVVVITAFLASYLSPIMITAPLAAATPPANIGYVDALMPALIVTVIAAVIGVAAYFAYAAILKRGEGSSS